MGDTLTLKQRMQLLNLDQVARTKPSLPQKPPVPAIPPRPQSTGFDSNQLGQGHASSIGNLPAAAPKDVPIHPEKKRMPPPLPRRDSAQIPPPAPQQFARRPSEQLTLPRRSSQESIASTTSTISTLSTRTAATTASRTPSYDGGRSRNSTSYVIRAPEFDPSSLPKLPPKPSAVPSDGSCAVGSKSAGLPPPQPAKDINQKSRPPPLPSRRSQVHTQPVIQEASQVQEKPASHSRRPSNLPFGFTDKLDERPKIARSVSQQVTETGPPPVPTGSRPDLSRLQATKPKPKPSTFVSPSAAQTSCLKCRDFSAPDRHAARFPRESLGSTDVAWLAHQLCDPFPSLTDKARAIFMWLHFNISYNCAAFFSNNVKASTPASTIASGLAVCEGYAGLFAALATSVGMESIVIGGHGKGFGYRPLQPGEPVPPFDLGHAWNAVRIDNGQWKLIDACWGAGYLSGENNSYVQHLSPEFFTMDNDEFGLRHYPQDRDLFLRADGRSLTWEEYMIGLDGPGEPLQFYGHVVGTHGLSQTSFSPSKKHIRLGGTTPKTRIQFQFRKVCDHFDGEKAGLGKPYVFVLAVGGKDGRKRAMIPFETDGNHWWVDATVEELGCQGQTVSLFAVSSVNGEDGRGMSVQYVKTWNGRRPMGYEGVAAWQLV